MTLRLVIVPERVPPQFETLPGIIEPVVPKGSTIAQRFAAFDAANPIVYELIVRYSRRWVEGQRRRGVANPRLGIARVVEAIRWDVDVHTEGDDFKINNNFRAHYARKVMANEPDLAGVFATRELRSA